MTPLCKIEVTLPRVAECPERVEPCRSISVPRRSAIRRTGAIRQAVRQGWAVTVRDVTLVDPPRRGLVRELGHGGDDPAPSRRPIIIASGREFICALRTFVERLFAVALEHELRRPPNVDLGCQSARLMKSPPGPPMTLGNAANAAANAKVRLIVWCKTCGRRVEPAAAEMAA